MTSPHPWDPLRRHELAVLRPRNRLNSFTSASLVIHPRSRSFQSEPETFRPLPPQASYASLASTNDPRRPLRTLRPQSSFASLPSPTEPHRSDTTEPELYPNRDYDYSDPARLTKAVSFHESLKGEKPQAYPTGLSLAILVLGVSLAAFLVALDRTIIATAIPTITDEFNAPSDVGWFGSAYLLTSCAFQPTFGRIFVHFDVRWAFLAALAVFEGGSLICGLAPNAVIFIVGRAVAGLGCAGVFAGVLLIITLIIPLTKRPIYMALIGSMFGVGSVCGPIIGGVFTDKLTWRWCFFVNLPVGLITFVTLVLFFHPPKRDQQKEGLGKKLLHLDPVGNLLLVTAVIMLLLALQWGGTEYAWANIKIIGLLVGSVVQTLVFIGWQAYLGADALIPLRLISQQTVAASLLSSFFLSGTLLVHSYYLPYWFQAIKGETAISSGVDTIPYLASNFVCSMVAGGFVTKVGYFQIPALLGSAIATIGSGLITTFTVNIPTARWIGYVILTGGGIGASIQQGLVAVQAVLPADVVPIATTLIIFAQSLAGAIFVSVANSLLRNGLEAGLQEAELPGVNIAKVLAAGATQVKEVVPASQLAYVYLFYNDALDTVFTAAVPMAALGFLCALGMEWKNLKGKKKQAVGEE